MEKQGGYLPQSNENGPVTWDTEEDHLLSYFLGESQASQHTTGAHYNGGSQNLTIAPGSQRMTPSTPAVQFYASSKGSQPPPGVAPLQSSSSSSSSLSSMAATLVNGGPVLHHYHHAQAAMRPHSSNSNNTPPSTNISPISPAATMGTPQEMLMLPPPPRNYGDGGAKSEAERQQHLAWLNQINTLAMMNRQPQVQLPDQQQQQQQVMMQPPPPPQYGAPLAPTPVFHPPNHLIPPPQQPPAAESEERRARRLARNRESARQSRRRKKEHLARLSKQVNGLHEAIEDERRVQLRQMETNLQQLRYQAIQQLPTTTTTAAQTAPMDATTTGPAPTRDEIRELLDNLGPNCAVRQTCVSFQYSALQQLMLPKYQAFILWLTLQDEHFFAAGKEQKAKNARVSSKQIGEELTNDWKKGLGTTEEDDMLQARADEAARLWPLFCFEMSISVDQEDKLLAFYKRAQELAHKDRSEMADATKMVMNMKQGILNHCQSTVGRSEQLFSSTLSPAQSAAYFKWYTDNAELTRKQAAAAADDDKGETTIRDLCQRLTQVLTLPSSSTSSMTVEDEPR